MLLHLLQERKRLSSDLRENGLVVTYDKDLKYGVEAGQIVVTAGKLLTGIEYPAAKWVLISEGDIFKGREEKKAAGGLLLFRSAGMYVYWYH